MKFGAVGSPDIVCVIKGVYVGIEVKTPNGKLSEHQIAFQKNLEAAEGVYVVARDIADVIDFLAQYV